MRQTTPHHPSDDELLLAADRELQPARQVNVGRHLSNCQTCALRLGRMQELLRDAGTLYQHDYRARPDRDVARPRLQRALGELSETWERSWSTRLRRALAASHAWAVVGVAASLLLVVAWLSEPTASRGPGDQGTTAIGAARPIASFTPGAVAPLTASELCDGATPSRRVSVATRDQVLDRYGMRHVSVQQYELDALITPELGGTTDAANLWPQMYALPVWNARVKDELERLLARLVCRGQLDLARAQQEIATDWIAAYKRHFQTDAPAHVHVGPSLETEDELEFESPYVRARSLNNSRPALMLLARRTE